MKNYKVKEIFFTLQGEGYHAGRPAVFCRFTGCNLWSGREEDRADAVCDFCDTEFVGTDGLNGGRYLADELAEKVKSLWPDASKGRPFVVCTGGEPLLQLDTALIDAFHQVGLEIAVETNGTLEAPDGIDWICVSPKADAAVKQIHGHELKLVYPQAKALPERFEDLSFDHFYLQPMDGPNQLENTQKCLAYIFEHPQWSLSVQTHKWLNIP
jgi:7-carboxy-7-deazaguanine synthase